MTAFPAGMILGYPRIGRRRELKRAVESHWAGKTTEAELEATAAQLRSVTRGRLAELGLGKTDASIPESFSYYDQVLDLSVTLGALPTRFQNLRSEDGDSASRPSSPQRAARGERPARDDEVVRRTTTTSCPRSARRRTSPSLRRASSTSSSRPETRASSRVP